MKIESSYGFLSLSGRWVSDWASSSVGNIGASFKSRSRLPAARCLWKLLAKAGIDSSYWVVESVGQIYVMCEQLSINYNPTAEEKEEFLLIKVPVTSKERVSSILSRINSKQNKKLLPFWRFFVFFFVSKNMTFVMVFVTNVRVKRLQIICYI